MPQSRTLRFTGKSAQLSVLLKRISQGRSCSWAILRVCRHFSKDSRNDRWRGVSDGRSVHSKRPDHFRLENGKPHILHYSVTDFTTRPLPSRSPPPNPRPNQASDHQGSRVPRRRSAPGYPAVHLPFDLAEERLRVLRLGQ